MSDYKTGFHIHSVGTVAVDKDEDDVFIEIHPTEKQPHVEGDISEKKLSKIESTDIYGNKKNIVLEKGATVRAMWIPIGNSNRFTAPNVKKGEQVFIYRYSNTDGYYWDTMFNEIDLRRKEKVIYVFGNTDNPKEELTLDNSYWFKIDTINKMVHLKTNDNDGEKTSYDVLINTKDGLLSVKDGKGNIVSLDSAIDKLTASILKDVEVNTENLTINAKKISLNADETEINSKVKITGSELSHNGKNVGSTHNHNESIGSVTAPPNPI